MKKFDEVTSGFNILHDDIWEVVIYNLDDEEIFRQDISPLICNNNNVCNGYENYELCPSDCDADSEDGVCNERRDLVCDPDCGEFDSAVGA